MSEDKSGLFGQIFIAMMIFCGLVWIWTVAFIMAWPWEKNAIWKPEFRVAAVCAQGERQGEVCSFPYGGLAEARQQGLIATLALPGNAGEAMEENGWLRWTQQNGIVEAKASSWHFQTTVRYRLDGDEPVLIEYQDVSARAFYYALAAAAFSLLGIYLRKLRR